MTRLLRALDAAAPTGAVLGAGVGLLRGRRFLAGRFDLAVLQPLLDGVLGGLAAAVLFAGIYTVLRAVFDRRLDARWSRLLSVLGGGLPLVVAAGYLLNRTLGIRPSQLLTPWALTRNLLFLALCALLCLGMVWLLGRRQGAVRPGLGALGALALALAVWAGHRAVFRAGSAIGPPDVVVILVDALRADHLSSYGYERSTTPRIDELAADAVLFRQATASSTFTKTSVASLFTGRHPYHHGVYWGNRRGAESPGSVTSDVLSQEETTMAEVLLAGRHLTGAWIQNSHLREFMGFGQGFVAFHDQQGPAHRINRGFFRFLEGPGRRWPFFAYLHYIDLHDPYRPEPPWAGRFGGSEAVYEGIDLDEWGAYLQAVRDGEVTLGAETVETMKALYDEQLRFVDAQVGEVLDRLRAEGRYEGSVIVLTSDHGDAFLEHGFLAHSAAPYEELVRVPLVLKLPGGRHGGRVVEEPVRLIDVMPTVLAAVGRPIPRSVDGCSLLPFLRETLEEPAAEPGASRPEECRVAVIEIAEDPERYPTVAIRTARWKLVHREGGPDELYDLQEDPGETRNLLGPGAPPPPVAEDLLRRALAVVASRPATGERMELDEATIEQLKALGYL